MPKANRTKAFLPLGACIPILVFSLTMSTNASSAESAQPRYVELLVTDSGQYMLAGKPVALSELRARLRELKSSGAPIDLHIKGDPKVKYKLIMPAVQIAQEEGLAKVGFIAGPAAAPDSATSPSSK